MDLELLSISLPLLKAEQGSSVDTDDQNASRGQREVLLHASPEKKQACLPGRKGENPAH